MKSMTIFILGNVPTNHWSTIEKESLRKHFKLYYDLAEQGVAIKYPSAEEIQRAIKEEPEFRSKSVAVVRSKLQHEFGTIERKREEEEWSDEFLA